MKYCGWKPVVPLRESIKQTLDFFLQQAISSGEFGIKK
jgi:nucleoside-diphosphate-sugar epimerase